MTLTSVSGGGVEIPALGPIPTPALTGGKASLTPTNAVGSSVNLKIGGGTWSTIDLFTWDAPTISEAEYNLKVVNQEFRGQPSTGGEFLGPFIHTNLRFIMPDFLTFGNNADIWLVGNQELGGVLLGFVSTGLSTRVSKAILRVGEWVEWDGFDTFDANITYGAVFPW